MQFLSDGNLFKVVRITGPTHNFLGLRLSEEEVREKLTSVEALVLNSHEVAELGPEDVRAWALKGVGEANSELGTRYVVDHIQFVANDSPPAEIYRTLAKSIVTRLHRHPDSYDGISD